SCHPTLLIADEPTTALDVTTQTQILELMRQLQREDGMAIMLITHDLGVIAEMATDVAVMYLGRVVEQAPVDEIFHAPRPPYHQAPEALPDPEGLLEADGGPRPRGRWRRFSHRRRRNARPCRRKRLREDDHCTMHRAGHRANGRGDAHAYHRWLGGRRGRAGP